MQQGELDVFEDADLYDAEYRTWVRDAGFYRRSADRLLGGPAEILELACGTGRVTRALVRGGHRVIALDRSAPMLRRAQGRLARLPRGSRDRAQLVQADMRHFALRRRFALAVCAFNSFEHLYTAADVAATLACVRAHLAVDGVLLFDVHNPDPGILARRPGREWGKKTFRIRPRGDTSGGPSWVRRTLSSRYQRDTQIHHVTAHYQPLAGDRSTPMGPPFRRTLAQRQFWPRELDSLVEASGFTVALRLGEFDGSLFEGDSPSQILFCQPAATTCQSRGVASGNG